jgi:hypothetical protein
MAGAAADLLLGENWQMSPGERAAIEGLLAHLSPALSIELGTFRGGSLRRIAAHSRAVHSFDMTLQVDRGEFPNVTFHIGDSHALLSGVLAEIESAGERVGFALVDGDHSSGGARQDVLDLLESPALSSGVIVMHDTANEAVRRGLESVPYEQHAHIALVDLDFVPSVPPAGRLQDGWGGLGLILLEEHRSGAMIRTDARTQAGDRLALVREARRGARRLAAGGLRMAGLHPSQRRR